MSKNITKQRHHTPKVHLDNNGKNLTSHAGLIPVIKFLDQIGLVSKVLHHLPLNYGNNAKHHIGDAVFMVLTGLIAGAFNLSKCAQLWNNEVLRKVSGRSDTPVETTLSRLYKRLGDRDIYQMEHLNHVLRRNVWQKALRSGASKVTLVCQRWIDADSSVKTVYGNQEGAAKGYNPHKRGAKSYHPLLAFCTETKEILQGWFRTGSAYTSNGIVEFMRQLLAELPHYQRIIFRADSGFFVGELLEFLDSLGHGYLIKVKLKNLAQQLMAQHWSPVRGQRGWEQCEFQYQAKGWSRPRFFLAVRIARPSKPSPQDEMLEKIEYDFFCYVTTEPLTPWQAHKCYGERATSETWIEEAKSQLGMAQIKTSEFIANAALFQTAILAYNTLRWMALLSGNRTLQQWEPESIRTFLVQIAGKLRTGGNQLRLQLPRLHLYPQQWEDWLAFNY